jgi:hypothetical protein
VVQSRDFTLRVIGTELGFGTSRRDSHRGHLPGRPPIPGMRCSGCRWKEVQIFLVREVLEPEEMYGTLDGTMYLLATVGRSIVPGERDIFSTLWADSPAAVLDGLLMPPKRHFENTDGMELPQPSQDALADAAEEDPDLARVLELWERGEDAS